MSIFFPFLSFPTLFPCSKSKHTLKSFNQSIKIDTKSPKVQDELMGKINFVGMRPSLLTFEFQDLVLMAVFVLASGVVAIVKATSPF